MKEGWLIDATDQWVWRFHRDNSAWVRDPKVLIDRGRQMPAGPPLLKERRYLRKDAAEQMWKLLQTQDKGGRRQDLYGVRPPNPAGVPPHLNPNPVKIAAATQMAGAYNLKKVLPRHVLQRRQPPQINLPARTLE